MTLGYSPFGLKQKGYNNIVNGGNDLAQNWKYNGKELMQDLGLNMYDYGARFYDPAVGRWFTPDALAEKYYDQSIYNYTINNPILFVDPDGNEVQMCCEELLGLVTDYYSNMGSGFVNTLESAGEGISNLVSDPVGTIGTAVSNHVNSLSTIEGVFGIVETAITMDGYNPITTAATDIVTAVASDNPAASLGNSVGEDAAGKLIDGAAVAAGAGASKVINAVGVSKTVKAVVKETVSAKGDGIIYKVPGKGTESGKPYIGRTKQGSASKRGRGAKDGRDRSQAKTIDRYNSKNGKEGSYKEQRAINKNGGKGKLDNKRNEMSKKNYDAAKKKYGN